MGDARWGSRSLILLGGIAAIVSEFGSCGTWSLFACFGVFGGREILEVLRGWSEIYWKLKGRFFELLWTSVRPLEYVFLFCF
jgi:hypothetical protein